MNDRPKFLDQLKEDMETGVPHFRRRQQRRRIAAGAAGGISLIGAIAGLVVWTNAGPPTESVAAVNNGSESGRPALTETVGDLADQATNPERAAPTGVEDQRLTLTVTDILDELGALGELGDVGFESLLLTGGRFEAMPDLRAAVTTAELDALRASLPRGERLPEVDLETSIVIAFSFIDDACPPTLVGFDEEPAGVLTPVLEEPPGGCRLPAIARRFIVALDRDDVAPGFILRVTQLRRGETQEHALFVDVPAELRDHPPLEADTDTVPGGEQPEPAGVLKVYDAGGAFRCYSESVAGAIYDGPTDVVGFANLEEALNDFWSKEYGGGRTGYPYERLALVESVNTNGTVTYADVLGNTQLSLGYRKVLNDTWALSSTSTCSNPPNLFVDGPVLRSPPPPPGPVRTRKSGAHSC